VTPSVAVSDFVGRRYRCYLFYIILAALGVSGVSMDMSFYGS
jgi:hypothetical protein